MFGRRAYLGGLWRGLGVATNKARTLGGRSLGMLIFLLVKFGQGRD